MPTNHEVAKFIRELLVKHPDKQGDILEAYSLYQDEVDAGESEENERNLLYNYLEEEGIT